MTLRVVLVALVALLVGGAGLLLVPADREQFSMLIKDHDLANALVVAQRRYAAGDHDEETLLAIYELNSEIGDVRAATAALEEYAAQHTDDPEALLELADHYRTIQEPDRRVAILEDVAALDLASPAVGTLLGLYRMRGEYAKERKLLERRAAGGAAGPAELARLGILLAQQGDLARARDTLRALDEKHQLAFRRERLLLFSLLLDLGEYRDAFVRGILWSLEWRNPSLTEELSNEMAAAGRPDLARMLTISVPLRRAWRGPGGRKRPPSAPFGGGSPEIATDQHDDMSPTGMSRTGMSPTQERLTLSNDAGSGSRR